MKKQTSSGLFVNDGSFMERFNQLQQEKEKGSVVEGSKLSPTLSENATPKTISKIGLESKATGFSKTSKASSSGKLAFSLKQKPKLVAAPVKLDEDEDEDDGKEAGIPLGYGSTKRQKLEQLDATNQSSKRVDVAPPFPSDPTVKMVADKLASFVAKNGRQFEDVTRQKNPGDTPFKFLFDKSCDDYKYYVHRLIDEENAQLQSADPHTSQNGAASSTTFSSRIGSQRSHERHPNYQISASALYDDTESSRPSGESSGPAAADPVAMMEFYAKKAAQEERRRQPKQSKDEMPPPASLQASSGKRGHHMGDYIPDEELLKFMANCDDVAAQKAAKAAADKARIQADNVGHKLLSKMGWKEGEGLGSSRSGIADPIMAGGVKKDHLGVGAAQPGEVTPEDDIYEQYKKRMMLGYRYRPNPMNNPRKAYY